MRLRRKKNEYKRGRCILMEMLLLILLFVVLLFV